jgi:5,10-methenyltetrahydromethanopterin hydrogenase
MSEVRETAEHEVREVARGRRWYTPFAVVGGVAAIVWAVSAIVIAVALVLWLVL